MWAEGDVMTTVAEYEQAPEYVWTANNSLAFTPMGMPPAAYPLLVRLLGRQEPGGRCLFTHDALSAEVAINRTQVTRGL